MTSTIVDEIGSRRRFFTIGPNSRESDEKKLIIGRKWATSDDPIAAGSRLSRSRRRSSQLVAGYEKQLIIGRKWATSSDDPVAAGSRLSRSRRRSSQLVAGYEKQLIIGKKISDEQRWYCRRRFSSVMKLSPVITARRRLRKAINRWTKMSDAAGSRLSRSRCQTSQLVAGYEKQ